MGRRTSHDAQSIGDSDPRCVVHFLRHRFLRFRRRNRWRRKIRGQWAESAMPCSVHRSRRARKRRLSNDVFAELSQRRGCNANDASDNSDHSEPHCDVQTATQSHSQRQRIGHSVWLCDGDEYALCSSRSTSKHPFTNRRLNASESSPN